MDTSWFNADSDRRVFQRFSARFPAKLLDSTLNCEVVGHTCDISAKGLSVTMPRQMARDTQVEVWLKCESKSEPLYSRGTIVWCRQEAAAAYTMGIRLEKAELMCLSRLLHAG